MVYTQSKSTWTNIYWWKNFSANRMAVPLQGKVIWYFRNKLWERTSIKTNSTSIESRWLGVEPSSEALDYIKNSFPSLKSKVGFGDDVPYKKNLIWFT